MNTKREYLNQGFTLLEMLLVVAIIAILAGIVVAAINPGKQLATVRNTERAFNLNEIHKAMQQYFIDNYHYPAATPTTLTEICNTGSNSTSTGIDCTGLIDLSPLVPTYITAIPTDPQGSTLPLASNFIPTAYASTNGTGYQIMKDSNSKIVLIAPQAELSAFIAIGTTTPSGEETPAEFSVSGDEGTTSTINGDIVYCDNVLQMWTIIAASNYTWGPVQDEPSDSCIGLGASYPACNYCDTLTYAGYSDWVLPTKDELVAALTEQFIADPPTMTGFAEDTTSYWSSSEYVEGHAWFAYYSFGTVDSSYDSKEVEYPLRCVR